MSPTTKSSWATAILERREDAKQPDRLCHPSATTPPRCRKPRTLLARQSAPRPSARYLQGAACQRQLRAGHRPAPRFTLWQRRPGSRRCMRPALPQGALTANTCLTGLWVAHYAPMAWPTTPRRWWPRPSPAGAGQPLLATGCGRAPCAGRGAAAASQGAGRVLAASAVARRRGRPAACTAAGLMRRAKPRSFTGQNRGWRDFDDFLASLEPDKRKKIRQSAARWPRPA